MIVTKCLRFRLIIESRERVRHFSNKYFKMRLNDQQQRSAVSEVSHIEDTNTVEHHCVNPFVTIPDTLTAEIMSNLSLEDKMKSICRVSKTFNIAVYQSLSPPHADPWDISIFICDGDTISVSTNTVFCQLPNGSNPRVSGIYCVSNCLYLSSND